MKIGLYGAMTDPNLLGKTFAQPSFWTWKVIAKLVDGLPLTEDREHALYQRCTGRTTLPQGPVHRLYPLVGRRGGKDRFMSAVAVWQCVADNWRQKLSAGETGVVILIGTDRRQANILRRYCLGLTEVPLIQQEVLRVTASEIEFRNGSELAIVTNDVKLVRGRSALAVLGTEVAFWTIDEESPSSDAEVVAAAVPSMSMTPGGGYLILASSPYRKSGVLFEKWRELWGNEDSDQLVWVAPSTTMNPVLPVEIVERALEEDSEKNHSEYGYGWREDLSDFVPSDAIDACTEWSCLERCYDPAYRYTAFCDAAGGTGSDAFTLAIGHRDEHGRAVLDVLREHRPRFVPAEVVAEYAELIRAYGCREVTGDRFSGGWVASEFEKHKIRYTASERSKSELYLACLPMLLAGTAVLLDHERLRRQFGALERRTHTGNRESVDHRAGCGHHDDLANAAAGALVLALHGGFMAIGTYWGPDGKINWLPPQHEQKSRFRVITLTEAQALQQRSEGTW
jgi:hypothetical protein